MRLPVQPVLGTQVHVQSGQIGLSFPVRRVAASRTFELNKGALELLGV